MDPAKQKLTPNDTFVRMPDISNDDDELKLSEVGSRKPPNLPKIKEINQFFQDKSFSFRLSFILSTLSTRPPD